ncbi:hypothetical protein LTR53_014471 [Teratosphaeriaceae sp. CCFEE 6253]|nr:hypothetical protein LTR53_014471 [Teratosphaeriaceae sp. CCFEE 6253]
MGSPPDLDDQRFRMREARKADVSAMTDVFFHSFNAPFWQYFLPETPDVRRWWDQGWALGIDSATDRSFVVEDSEQGDRIVAFSRWMTPQSDGNQVRECWPEMPGGMDMEVADAFFSGMEANRHAMMEKRPHWFLEMLGVHEDYQKHGIGATLIKWGTDQADADGLQTYLDASEIGWPYYKRRHAFAGERPIAIPDRPQYGSFTYRSLVRQPQKALAG